MLDRLGLVGLRDQILVDDVIADRHRAAHPYALGFGVGDLVAHPLGDDLAFELGEAEQNVQRQPAHADGGAGRRSRGVRVIRSRWSGIGWCSGGRRRRIASGLVGRLRLVGFAALEIRRVSQCHWKVSTIYITKDMHRLYL